MSIKYKKNIKRLVLGMLAMSLVFIKAECIFTPTITQPTAANAGDIISIDVKSKFVSGYTEKYRLVIGFFAPKGWAAGNNTTMTYTSDVGSGNLTKMPANTKPSGETVLNYPDALKETFKTKNPNLIDDNEYVVFWSDEKQYSSNQTVNFTVNIKTKVGPESMLVKLGYYIGGYSDGGWKGNDNSKVAFTDCFTVNNGTGDGIDFCNKPLASATPLRGTDNDFFTIAYDNDLFSTPLSSASKVYLCVKGYTASGEVIERCTADDKSMFIAGEQKRFTKVIWPRGFLGLTNAQVLTRMEYFIIDDTGKKVGFGGSPTIPFIFRFNCN